MSERYQIKAKIGQGGIGAVYRAFDTHLQREVAIKRLLPPDESESFDEDPTKGLVKEATTLSSLQHPNVVSVYDVGSDEDGAFVVMELVEGETFDQVVERGVLMEDDFDEMVSQTLEALIAAQEKDLVHRDIKPTNLMVKWLPSGKFQFKLLDFGLAKFSPRPTKQTIGLNDAILGSIHFMAPEQFERGHLDGRTDLYAIGCIYYYGLAGCYPYDGETGAEVMGAHLSHRVTPLHEMRPDISRRTCSWVMWLMSREMKDRPANAHDALEAFYDTGIVIPGSHVGRLMIPGAGPGLSRGTGSVQTVNANNQEYETGEEYGYEGEELEEGGYGDETGEVEEEGIYEADEADEAEGEVEVDAPADDEPVVEVIQPRTASGPSGAPQMRPGTGPVRPGTGPVRPGTGPVRPATSTVRLSTGRIPVSARKRKVTAAQQTAAVDEGEGAAPGMVPVIDPAQERAYKSKMKRKLYIQIAVLAGVLVVVGFLMRDRFFAPSTDVDLKEAVEYVNTFSAGEGSAEWVRRLVPFLNPPSSLRNRQEVIKNVEDVLQAMNWDDEEIDAAMVEALKESRGSTTRRLIPIVAGREIGDAVPHLVELTKHENVEIATEALNAVAGFARRLEDDQLVGIGEARTIMGVLVGADDESLRRQAETTLGVIVDHALPGEEGLYVGVLEDGLRSTRPEPVRRASVRLLGKTGHERAAELLAEAVKGSGRGELQIAALAALGDWPDDSQIDVLFNVVKDADDQDVRGEAFRSAVSALRRGMDRRDPEQHRKWWETAAGLAETRGEKNHLLNGMVTVREEWILELIGKFEEDEDSRIRNSARQAAAQVRNQLQR